jgi:hypothetical protein
MRKANRLHSRPGESHQRKVGVGKEGDGDDSVS